MKSRNMNYWASALLYRFSILFSVLLLTGCALPLPYQIASWALDGISYMATEKSVTDHGLSIIAQKDCALLRVVHGNEICSANDDSGTFAVAKNDNANTVDKSTVITAEKEETTTADGAKIGKNSQLDKVSTPDYVNEQSKMADRIRILISGARIWSDRLDADMYYVVGSFSNPDYAQNLISKHSDLGPAVLVSLLNGNKIFRVAVGPFKNYQRKEVKLSIEKAGINKAWAMYIDHQKWKVSSSHELFNTEKPVVLAPEIIKPITKIRPSQKQMIDDEVAKISLPKDKVSMNTRRKIGQQFPKT